MAWWFQGPLLEIGWLVDVVRCFAQPVAAEPRYLKEMVHPLLEVSSNCLRLQAELEAQSDWLVLLEAQELTSAQLVEMFLWWKQLSQLVE
jgi:hypothetical protein